MVVAGLVGLSLARPAFADGEVHRLSEDGTALGVLFTDGKIDDLRFTVDLDGDVPLSTHVWATFGSNIRRVRTNTGYWLPFSGHPDDLVDNHFPVENGRVVFKVLDEDIGTDNHGVTLSIGYKTSEGLKYGFLSVHPEKVTP